MGKTVFGIPSVNEKSQSGGAVAPKGTTGQSASSGSGGGQGEKKAPSQQKSPMAKPAMAKPAMARTAPAKSAPASRPVVKNSSASKTMFGMPAMNIPAQGTGSPATVSQQKSVASPEKEALSTAAAEEKKGEAYMATMMGVPAVTGEMAQDSAVATPDVVSAPQQSQAVAPTASATSTVIQTTTQQPVDTSQVAAPIQSSDVEEPPAAIEEQPADVGGQIVAEQSASAVSGVTPSTPVVKSPEPPQALVVGLIVGFLFLVGSIGFVAWKFLFI